MTSPLKYGVMPCLILGLAACEDGNLLTRGSVEAEPEVAVQTSSVTRDVEMPDVFSVRELGLWDGRPSLGGVWVAHPDVADPERVKIENTVTGQTVEGALFRRERDNPGPRIQVSSEAAKALEILAGQPTELALVVVREETVEIEVPAPDPLAIPAGEDAPVSAMESVVVADGDLSENSAVEPMLEGELAMAEPERKGFWARLRDSLRREPAPVETSASAIAAGADLAVDAGAAVSAPAVETATLDPIASVASAAIAEAETEAAEKPENAYIQVGLFGKEDNARGAAEKLRGSGILPGVTQTEVGGKSYWRVVVGPLTTASDREQVIETVRDLGFRDAYFTSS